SSILQLMVAAFLVLAAKGGPEMTRKFKTMDANEAVANVAYRLNEVIAIYPITPSSAMGEWADQWASEGMPNIWGSVPQVVEMKAKAVPLVPSTERCRRGRSRLRSPPPRAC